MKILVYGALGGEVADSPRCERIDYVAREKRLRSSQLSP